MNIESGHHYDEKVIKSCRLSESEDLFDIKEKSLVDAFCQDLKNLPDIREGKVSIVLKGKFAEKPVALRKIPKLFQKRADREMKVLRQTENLCQTANYIFYMPVADFNFIMMPLYEYNLEEYLQINKDMTKASKNNVIRQIASGLAELHGRGIVHMDLRPTKIFIQGGQNKERVIIANFRKSKVDGTTTEISTMSKFAAPEVRGSTPPKEVSDKADMYSLGLIAFFMWSYNTPYGEAFRTFPDNDYAIANIEHSKGNKADKNLLTRLLKNKKQFRPSAQQVMKHPSFWGEDGVGIYMTILDDILRTENFTEESWWSAFQNEKTDQVHKMKDWREEAATVLSSMRDKDSYSHKKKCFVRFVRNLWSHLRTNDVAKLEIGSRGNFSNWVVKKFEKLFFDIFDLTYRHMDGFYSTLFFN